ncbi:hypothetical protein OSB04_002726 [Centaurea solstitialis]|uniref:Retrovirus-related Pol polyprotein from transposon TNT 1-94-like beta-barrel domain-containing protein n=1 Tax=Centaurea solstitialis TaxID=347529 RepID=A0AA38TTI3_9ASTR|nr:hypothetical protein OSB04_002726 [Centaurea solstitialis]
MTTSSPSNTLTPPTASQLVFALTNIYSQFSFKLSTDGSKYKLWRRIFLDMCKGAKVHGHITGKSKPAGDDDEDWEAIDSRIKSWFYTTCDANLLQIISSDNCTAKDLWDKLDEFFLNNKMSLMLQLQEQIRNTKKGTLSITDFCHNLKNLADALADCDSKIDEVELVMQILHQLPPSYHSIVDVITNTKPFPSFLEAKNMLLLHESREESIEPHIDTPLTSSAALYSSAQSALNGKSKNKFNKGRNNGRVASRGGNTNVSASSHSFAGNQGHSQAYFGTSPTTGHVPSAQPGLLAPPFHQTPVNSHPYYYGIPQAPTPVPVSTQFTQHVQPSMPVPPPPQPSFGGHASQYSQPQYTDLSSVFQAMSVQPPQDNNFYMDTGASRHMTFNQGTMHSLTPCNSSFIQVGNGAVVPARYIGQCKLPFSPWPLMLKNVLVSDKLIKNLALIPCENVWKPVIRVAWLPIRMPTGPAVLLHHVVSRSSAEAEYRGIANVVAETAWLRNLLLELCCPLFRATVVFCDNVSAMYLASNPVQHQRTKHVEIDLHFVRERVAIGHVRVLHVPSAYQYADIFTKGLPTSLFLDFRNSLNIRLPPDQTTGVC